MEAVCLFRLPYFYRYIKVLGNKMNKKTKLSLFIAASISLSVIAGQEVHQKRDNIEADVEALLLKLTLKEKVSLVHASGKFHINAIERVGIPEMWLSDGPHGVRHQIERHTI